MTTNIYLTVSGGWESGCSLAMWIYIIASPEDTIKVLPGPQLSSRSAGEDLLPIYSHSHWQISDLCWLLGEDVSFSSNIFVHKVSYRSAGLQWDLQDAERETERQTEGETKRNKGKYWEILSLGGLCIHELIIIWKYFRIELFCMFTRKF